MVTKRHFGVTKNSEDVYAYTISNDRGIAVTVLDYGATLQSVVLTHKGEHIDVVLGYETIEEYENNDGYVGASIGRFAGRIPDAILRIGEAAFPVAANENGNQLHGGRVGFDKRIWAVEYCTDSSVRFDILSPDGDEGYPGTVHFSAVFSLDEDALTITYEGVSDRVTAWNPTNHAYWNLNGHAAGDARMHLLQIPADRYIPVDAELIPIGGEQDVTDSRYDFLKLRTIAGAYDNSFILHGGPILLWGERGIGMEIKTDCKAVQVYNAEFLSARKGKDGAIYRPFGAVCLETQGRQAQCGIPLADENILDHPGIPKSRKTVFRFLIKED